jgi:hypothetical protein
MSAANELRPVQVSCVARIIKLVGGSDCVLGKGESRSHDEAAVAVATGGNGCGASVRA